ncbi:CpaF family protein [Falsiroseomonas sp. E2-1-a4]|uniref:CpaF family protein n=1 Tax=Falsiroseomonas sp. E2-1-a4 TaxID=3239299 RepID=UPI003F358A37
MTGFGRRLHVVPPLRQGSATQPAGTQGSLPPSTSNELTVPPRPIEADDTATSARSAAAVATLLRLRQHVLERIDPVSAGSLSVEQLREEIGILIHEIADRDRLDLSGRVQIRLVEDLVDEMLGHGPLEPLLRDDRVDDILVNGPNRVFVEVGGKMQLSAVRFRDGRQLAGIAQKMAAKVGRRVDESSPLVDCRLPDGSRVNIVFPPLAIDGVSISIRKFSRRRYGLDALVENGSFTAPVARILEIAARCRLNIVVSGGTGSGKTTLLNAMSSLIDHGERIVTIEDAAELQLQQPHVVRLETRPPNLEGQGEINQRALLRNALRMRPDRIILGECRGAEAFDMLQAMNTGHDGSICTLHANTARDALTRIENMVQMGTTNLPHAAIRYQIAGALDLVVQVERMRDGQRRVIHVAEVCGMEGDVITMNDVFAFEYLSEDATGHIRGRYVTPNLRPRFQDRLRYFGLEQSWLEALRDA